MKEAGAPGPRQGGQNPGAFGVGPKGHGGIDFALIGEIKGGRVQDDVGRVAFQEGPHVAGVGDVGLGAARAHQVDAGGPGFSEVRPQLARAAEEENFHTRVSVRRERTA